MNIDVLDDLRHRGKTHDGHAFPRLTRFGFSSQGVPSPAPKTPGVSCERESSTDSHDANRIGVPAPTKGRGAELRTHCGGTLARAAFGVAISSAQATELSSPAALRNGDRELLQALVNSRVFAEYKRAFSGATGLPIALQPVESFRLPDHGKGNENPFCALLAQKNRSCGECLNVQASVKEAAKYHPHTAVCPAGLSETAVPVQLGNRLIGFLQTGQIFRESPTEGQFQRAVKWLRALEVDLDQDELRKAYFRTRVIARDEHASATKLLSVFAQHLSILSNQILIRRSNAESPWVTQAKAFIREHQGEHLRFAEVARVVNMSRFHFSKKFKQRTGLTFTGYLSRVRIENCKDLLLKPDLRVSEIAYEAGFQSVTQFNRVFRKIVGQSPTGFRRSCGIAMP
jgi:AraC-like DNA-binding protein/ligand-binding sensor protein